jgi:hypothetical protein
VFDAQIECIECIRLGRGAVGNSCEAGRLNSGLPSIVHGQYPAASSPGERPHSLLPHHRRYGGRGPDVQPQEEDCGTLAKAHGFAVAKLFADNDASASGGRKRPMPVMIWVKLFVVF